jgi:oligogalacturonide transport system substrate-binding protein
MSVQLTRRGVLAGVGAAATAGVARAAAPVTLRLSWWGGSEVHRAYLTTIRRFEAKYPHIAVKAEYTGWAGHLERLTTQIAGETAPDVMQINWNWLVLFSREGEGFYDLRRLGREIAFDQFDADSLSMGTVRGRLNAIPASMAARLFYFNATTYEKAGLKTPSNWDELFAAGPVFRERLGPDYFPLDLNLQDVVAIARTWHIQKTGAALVDETRSRLNANLEQMIGAADLYRRLVDEHVVPSARARASFGNVAPQEMRPWITGRYAGVHQWVSAIGKSADTLEAGQRIALGAFPLLPNAKDAGLLYRPAMLLAVNRGTRHPQESALLLNFLLNDPEAVRIFEVKRGAPVSKSALRVLEGEGALKGLAWEGLQQIQRLPNRVRESGFFEHPRVRDGFIDTYERLGYGRLDVEAAGRRMFEDVNAILRRVIR